MWGWPCHLRFVPNHEWGEKDLSLVQTSVWQAIVLRPKQGLFSAVHISPSLVRGQELWRAATSLDVEGRDDTSKQLPESWRRGRVRGSWPWSGRNQLLMEQPPSISFSCNWLDVVNFGFDFRKQYRPSEFSWRGFVPLYLSTLPPPGSVSQRLSWGDSPQCGASASGGLFHFFLPWSLLGC